MQQRLQGAGPAAPVLFQAGSIDNHSPLFLSPQHRVLLRSAKAGLLFAATDVFVPAKALINDQNIRLAPCGSITYVHLLLETHQVLIAEGAPCESLLLGEMALDLITGPGVTSGVFGNHHGAANAARPVLTYREARLLLSEPHERGIAAFQNRPDIPGPETALMCVAI